MKLSDEAEAIRSRLQKAIEQGSKLEYLYSLDEFNFFLSWINRMREQLAQEILRGRIPNDKLEWHAKGGYDYLTKVIEASENFTKAGQKARRKLEEYDKELKAIPEALRDV